MIQAIGAGVPAAAIPDPLTGDELYCFRQDAEGIPYSKAAAQKEPGRDAAHAAFVHMLLLNSGATKHGAWFEHNGRSIRVVNGAGQGLEQMKNTYREPPTVAQPEVVICAGAIDLGVPASLIPAGHGASMIRPAPGGLPQWMTLERARTVLGV